MTGLLIVAALFVVFLGLQNHAAAVSGSAPPENPISSAIQTLASGVSTAVASVTGAATTIVSPATGIPSGMTAQQWDDFKTNLINKYVGPTIGSYQKSTLFRNDCSAALDNRQLFSSKDAQGVIVPDQCGSSAGNTNPLLAGALTANEVTTLGQEGIGATAQISKAVSGVSAIPSSLATALPIVGSIVGIIANVVGSITAAHAAAEKTETSDLCQLIPYANSALVQIDDLWRSGQISSAEASQMLETLFQNFVTAAAPIISGHTSFNVSYGLGGQCNSACGYALCLRMICDVREQIDYAGGAL